MSVILTWIIALVGFAFFVVLLMDEEDHMITGEKYLDTYCPSCGDQRPSDHDFCFRCGDRLTKGEVCVNCGSFVEPGTLDERDFCEECRERGGGW